MLLERKSQIEEFAVKLGELEREYKVKIISSNGFTDAIIIDLAWKHGYDYHSGKGRITHSDECCPEEL